MDIAVAEYIWVISIAAWGGLVSWFAKVQMKRTFSVMELIGELVTAGFAGLAGFWLMKAAKLDPLLIAALVGICGHMGTRSLILIERLITRYFMRWVPNGSNTDGCLPDKPPVPSKKRPS